MHGLVMPENMGDENWPREQIDVLKVEGKWRRGRPQLRWDIALNLS